MSATEPPAPSATATPAAQARDSSHVSGHSHRGIWQGIAVAVVLLMLVAHLGSWASRSNTR
jgi:hypothetical protein